MVFMAMACGEGRSDFSPDLQVSDAHVDHARGRHIAGAWEISMYDPVEGLPCQPQLQWRSFSWPPDSPRPREGSTAN